IDDKELKRIVEECSLEKSSQKYLDWIARIEKRAKAIKGSQKPDQLYCIITIAKHMKAYNAAFEINSLARPCDVSNFLNERLKNCDDTKETCESYEKLKKTLDESKDTSNPNLETMKTLIKKNLVDKQEVDTKKSKGIIFVPTRFLAHALASWLNDCKDESLELLQASAFTGSQASGDKGGMTSSQQDSTLMKFRSGETKLLVATSFTEEGIDIPECSLVIRYNHVGNEVNTVQMRGRSRKKGGKSVLLACETLYIRESINQFNADLMEKAVKKVSKMDPREISKSNEVIQKEMLQNDKIKINNKFSKGPLRDEQFKMVCNRCKQTVIESKDIRLIDECHRIAISR
ncbi:retinoic acid-inducible protein ic, partial [Plakobranchus ocellatus]